MRAHFRVSARVSSEDPRAARRLLDERFPQGSVRIEGSDLVLEAEAVGETAKDLNRDLLSALRRIEKRTRLRAEWTSDDGTTERFFDYVLKKKGKP